MYVRLFNIYRLLTMVGIRVILLVAFWVHFKLLSSSSSMNFVSFVWWKFIWFCSQLIKAIFWMILYLLILSLSSLFYFIYYYYYFFMKGFAGDNPIFDFSVFLNKNFRYQSMKFATIFIVCIVKCRFICRLLRVLLHVSYAANLLLLSYVFYSAYFMSLIWYQVWILVPDNAALSIHTRWIYIGDVVILIFLEMPLFVQFIVFSDRVARMNVMRSWNHGIFG